MKGEDGSRDEVTLKVVISDVCVLAICGGAASGIIMNGVGIFP